jgi:hypothetical protein
MKKGKLRILRIMGIVLFCQKAPEEGFDRWKKMRNGKDTATTVRLRTQLFNHQLSKRQKREVGK